MSPETVWDDEQWGWGGSEDAVRLCKCFFKGSHSPNPEGQYLLGWGGQGRGQKNHQGFCIGTCELVRGGFIYQ